METLIHRTATQTGFLPATPSAAHSEDSRPPPCVTRRSPAPGAMFLLEDKSWAAGDGPEGARAEAVPETVAVSEGDAYPPPCHSSP